MAKTILEPTMAMRLLNFCPVLLVTSTYEERDNIITINWSSPVSFSPPLVAISVGHGRYSHYMIESSRQFTINIPDESLLKEVLVCGSLSGKKRDKFLESGLSKERGLKTNVPLIAECFANIECQIFRTFEGGDHTIFCGNVVSVLAEKKAITEDGVIDITVKRPIIHLGKDSFFTFGGGVIDGKSIHQ